MKMPERPKAVGRVPEKALCEMFIARSAGKKSADALPLALLGSGPLRHIKHSQPHALRTS